MNKKALIEGLKELARVAVIAAIPVIVSGIDTIQGGFEINWMLVQAVVAVAILKAIDKYIHKSDIELKGILPF
jgi:hypothetical protein